MALHQARNILAVVSAIFVVTLFLTTSAPADLIIDGSFEVNTNSTPGNGASSELGGSTYAGSTWGGTDVTTHWDKSGGRTWYMTDGGANQFPDGDFAYRLDAASNDGVDRLYQDGISLDAGSVYKLSFEMWGESASPRIDVDFTGPASMKVLDNSYTVGNDSATEQKIVLVKPTTSGAYRINFSADDPANGNQHAWIDAVQLEEVTLGPNLITDGSFEVNTNSAPGGGQGSELGSSTYAGSTWGGTDVTTHWDKSGGRTWYMTDGGANIFPDGDFAFRLDGAGNDGVDRLYQDGISLTAGELYELTFEMWGESASPRIDVDLTGPANMKLLDNEGTVGNDGATELMSVLFSPTATGLYRISFAADDPANGNHHAWIDNVALRAVQAVPEPSTILLAIFGLLGLSCCGLRRRS